uniref:Uncharacterized protein n=1 Tax=Trichogramma kaykai TaxID=54128 RepID=A0ABD2WF34_9HYME
MTLKFVDLRIEFDIAIKQCGARVGGVGMDMYSSRLARVDANLIASRERAPDKRDREKTFSRSTSTNRLAKRVQMLIAVRGCARENSSRVDCGYSMTILNRRSSDEENIDHAANSCVRNSCFINLLINEHLIKKTNNLYEMEINDCID